MKMALLLTGLLAVGFIGYASTTARAADEERNVSLRDLPQNLQDSIRHEAGKDRIDRITLITRGDRVFYRVEIQRANGEQMLNMSERGEVLAANDVAIAAGGADSGRAVRTADIPERAREAIRKQLGRGQVPDTVTEVSREGRRFYVVSADKPFRVTEEGDVLMPERIVGFNDLPRSVQDALTREMGDRRRGERAREVTFDGTTYYVVEYLDSTGRERTLAVDRDGRIAQQPALMSLVGETPEPGQIRPTDFDHLPGPVKAAIGGQRGSHELSHVYEVTREGQTYWVADVQERDGIRRIRVDGQGKIIGESKRPY